MEEKDSHICSVDRVSGLPVDILHSILSLLPAKDAAKTSILSKRWQYVWDSYPVVEFCGDFFSYLIDEENRAIKRYIDMADCRFNKLNYNIQRVKFDITRDISSELKYVLERWLGLILEKQVKELDFCISYFREIGYSLPLTVFSAGSLTVLKIKGKGCNLKLNDVRSSVNLPSLQTLSLCKVNTSDMTVRHLISSCPSLEDLELSYCRGLKVLNLSGMVKLVNVSLSGLVRVGLSNCQGLKSASFYDVELDCVFDDLNFSKIESLLLSRCILSSGFEISSHQLTKLVLRVQSLDDYRVFAPNLSSVELVFRNMLTNPTGCSIASISKLNAQYELRVELYEGGECVRTSWFIKLKEILQLQTATKPPELFIHFSEDSQTKFDIEKAWISCPSPPYILENLTLVVAESSEGISQIDFAAVLDGVFWCCHPDTLSLVVGGKFIRALCETLEEDQDDQVCCSSSNIKCWHHSFMKVMDVTVELEDNKTRVPFCWDALSTAVSDDDMLRIHFNLTW